MSLRTLTTFSLLALGVGLGACSEDETPPRQEAPAPAAVTAFTASATQVAPGGEVTLSWTVENATQVTLSALGQGPVAGVDPTASEGSLTVAVGRTTRYVLTAQGEGGSDARQLQVAVVSEEGMEPLFTAQPEEISAGEPVTLVWNVPGVASVTLTDQSGAAVDLGGQGRAGSVQVHPQFDTTYTLTFEGGSLSRAIDVLPAVFALEVNPRAGTAGQPVSVSWKAGGGTQLTLRSPGRGELVTRTEAALIADGSFQDTLPASLPANGFLEYEAVVTDGTVEAARTVSVYVGVDPLVEQFVVPPFGQLGTHFAVTWKTLNADQLEIAIDGQVRYQAPSAALVSSGAIVLPTPAQSTTVELRVSNARGGTAKATRTITPVGEVQLVSFTADQATIANGGEAVTLSWKIDEARRLKIVANNEVTVFSGAGEGMEEGSVVVYPNENTTYTLSADNTLASSLTATTQVAVTTPAVFTPSVPGTVVEGTVMGLSYTVGSGSSEIHGLPHPNVVKVPAPAPGFESIKTTGTKLTFSSTDNAVVTFNTDFETWLWGRRLSATNGVRVSTNGFLVFGTAAATRSANTPLPDRAVEADFIAPFWDDLRIPTNGGVYWQVRGNAPNRELVVEWDGLEQVSAAGSVLSFQARIHQTGAITFQYGTLTTTNPTPTIGVQGQKLASHVFALTHGGTVETGSAVQLFGPVASPAQVPLPAPGTYSGFVSIGSGFLQLEFSPSLIKAGGVAISEVLYSPAAAIAATGEWLEVYNPGAAAVDLAGFTLDFGNGQTHLIDAANGNTVVPAGGILVMGQSNVAAENDGVTVHYVYGPTFAMNDTAGTVSITRGGPLASLSWSGGAEGVSTLNDPGPVLLASDPAGTKPHGVSCTATQPFGTQTPQQRGSPGALAPCFDYSLQSIPGAFDDLAGIGTELLASASDYTGTGSVTLPAPFTYFGVSHTSVNVSMVGFLSFGPALTSAYDTVDNTLPSTTAPNGVIAVFWDQIVRNTNGTLLMHRRPDHTVISWQDFRIYAAGSNNMNFQIKLFDSGVIELHYGSMEPGEFSGADQTGSSATTWIESLTGDRALVANLNQQGGIQPNSGWRFTPRP